jgi:hypothetical protein
MLKQKMCFSLHQNRQKNPTAVQSAARKVKPPVIPLNSSFSPVKTHPLVSGKDKRRWTPDYRFYPCHPNARCESRAKFILHNQSLTQNWGFSFVLFL